MSDSEANTLNEVSCRIETLRASDHYRIGYRYWHAVGKKRGCVVAMHGIQSHSGWYKYSCRRMAAAGYDVFFLDRRGSGMNGTARGHAAHSDRLINDLRQFLAHIERLGYASPVLLGISWAGKLATAFAGMYPESISRLALLYPGLKAKIGANWFQRRLLAIAVAAQKIRKRIPIPLKDPALFTAEPAWQDFINRDHLALHRVSIGFLEASRQLDEHVQRVAPSITKPTILMLAGRDQVIDNELTQELVRQFATRDRTIHIYPEAAHTLEFEPNRDQIMNDLIHWLEGSHSDKLKESSNVAT